MHRPNQLKGFTLIEVLVTMLILVIGLLGLAGLHSSMLRSELESVQRTQALLLLEDMSNRLRTNPGVARAAGSAYLADYGTGSGMDCTTPATSEAIDMCAWDSALKGAAVTNADAGTSIGAMIGARGCVERLSGSATSQVLLRVSVAWQGLSATAAPDLPCGEDEFGDDDRLRRAASVVVALAYLGG